MHPGQHNCAEADPNIGAYNHAPAKNSAVPNPWCTSYAYANRADVVIRPPDDANIVGDEYIVTDHSINFDGDMLTDIHVVA